MSFILIVGVGVIIFLVGIYFLIKSQQSNGANGTTNGNQGTPPPSVPPSPSASPSFTPPIVPPATESQEPLPTFQPQGASQANATKEQPTVVPPTIAPEATATPPTEASGVTGAPIGTFVPQATNSPVADVTEPPHVANEGQVTRNL